MHSTIVASFLDIWKHIKCDDSEIESLLTALPVGCTDSFNRAEREVFVSNVSRDHVIVHILAPSLRGIHG